MKFIFDVFAVLVFDDDHLGWRVGNWCWVESNRDDICFVVYSFTLLSSMFEVATWSMALLWAFDPWIQESSFDRLILLSVAILSITQIKITMKCVENFKFYQTKEMIRLKCLQTMKWWTIDVKRLSDCSHTGNETQLGTCRLYLSTAGITITIWQMGSVRWDEK